MALAVMLVLLIPQLVIGEAFKSTSMGQVLGAIFIFGAGIPIVIGAGTCGIVWAINGRRSSLLLTVAVAVLAWWAGLLFASGNGFLEHIWLPMLLAIVGAILAATGSARPPHSSDPTESE